LINVGLGVTDGCLQENSFMLLGLQLFAGPFGKRETEFVLKDMW
jgi:hypothetical protein